MTSKPTFTNKQIEMLDKFKQDYMYYLSAGGSRSGKTFLDCRFLTIRAIKYPKTRHMICRASKRSCIESVWNQTLIPQLEEYLPKGSYIEDKTYKIIKFYNGSEIHAAGFDNKIHTDTALSKEYASILIVEASELPYTIFNKLLTRLNWNPKESDIKLKMILETNPPAPSHWSNVYFNKHIEYETKEKLEEKEYSKITSIHSTPEDNAANINQDYLDKLRMLKGKARKRFYEGVYYEDKTGLVYSFDRAINCMDKPIQENPNSELWRTWDFGIDPSYTAIIWYNIERFPPTDEFPMGLKINIIDEYIAKNKDYRHYVDIVNGKDYHNRMYRDAGDPAGNTRNESLESWISKLNEHGIDIETPDRVSISDYISNAEIYMPYVRINEQQCPHLVEMFESWSYPKDIDGNVIPNSKPEHDIFSHAGTSWYYGMYVTFENHNSKSVITIG